MGDPPKTRRIFQYRHPPLGECSRNPSVSVHQLVVVRDCVSLQCVFSNTLSVHSPVSRQVIYKLTCQHLFEYAAGFDPKRNEPHALSSLYTRSGPKETFCLFVFLDERTKRSSKKMFSRWGRSKTKNAEAVKSIKMDQFENS